VENPVPDLPAPGGVPLRLPSPVQEVREVDGPWPGGVRLFLKRDDLIHPDLPGNKWRKLRYNLAAARRHGTVLTFGGAYSGHLRAVAAAGRYFGFATIGVVRGEEHLPLNPSLAVAAAHGMRLTYLDRASYRAKHTPEVTARLRDRFGDFLLLPEGGSNAAAVRGCAEIPAELAADAARLGVGRFDVVCCACGTGGTLAGIAAGLSPGQRAVGFAVLRGGGFLAADVAALLGGGPAGEWSLETGYHFGGYARRTAELDRFAAGFERRHGVPLDRVYVAKMLYGVYDLAARGALAPGSSVVAVVTGSPFDVGVPVRAADRLGLG
jgi:1-aminocyclopropane-1-carboxylate deaminase